MTRKALALVLAATGIGGCAAGSSGSRPPEWQPRVDEISRSQTRLEMRVDEVTRSLLALRERLDAQEAALKKEKETKEPREEASDPALPVVKVEPLPQDSVPAGTTGAAAPAENDRAELARARVSAEESPLRAPEKPAPAELYRRAYSSFRDGRFGQAILDFEEFLRQYPGHEYSDNAQYWIGECYYSQREFGEAIVEFGRVIERYPREGKAPDALLKIGLCYQQLGETEKARAFWKRALSEYPTSEAAGQARKMLAPAQ